MNSERSVRSLFTVHMFPCDLLTLRGECFSTMPNGNGGQWQTEFALENQPLLPWLQQVWQQPQHAQSWCQFLAWFGHDSWCRYTAPRGQCSLFTVRCPMPVEVLCSMSIALSMGSGTKTKNHEWWTLNSCFHASLCLSFMRPTVFLSSNFVCKKNNCMCCWLSLSIRLYLSKNEIYEFSDRYDASLPMMFCYARCAATMVPPANDWHWLQCCELPVKVKANQKSLYLQTLGVFNLVRVCDLFASQLSF